MAQQDVALWRRPITWMLLVLLLGLIVVMVEQRQLRQDQQQRQQASRSAAWQQIEHWQHVAQLEAEPSWQQDAELLLQWWQLGEASSTPFSFEYRTRLLAQLQRLSRTQQQLIQTVAQLDDKAVVTPNTESQRLLAELQQLQHLHKDAIQSLSALERQLQLLQQRVDLQTNQLATQKMQLLALTSQSTSTTAAASVMRSAPQSADLIALQVSTLPQYAKVEVLNVRERFTQGMTLPQGQYLLRVSTPGFATINRWITLSADQRHYCVALAEQSLESPGPSEHQSTIFEAPCTW
ncbi:carboxypeptidase-like regulatory domain-containing protein [Ferrimonas senticii]|uniref:carboxypeptidase-like regulatory domain-containing protein n=1 Tax=Ferrimonas senticii TaxID=394566 RepID=UPI0003F8C000|nr:carboxypeptidase-like regulatory domain-containing protein [Ferrimonas senticii]